MSEEQMNSYRLTSMDEPGDERMAQIMREVAEDARESTRRAAERVAAGIEAASQAAQDKWGDAIELSMVATEYRPVLIVIAGPNGSGKTSVTSKILHHEWRGRQMLRK